MTPSASLSPASVPNPKCACFAALSGANFGFERKHSAVKPRERNMKTLRRVMLVMAVAVLWSGVSRGAEPNWPDHLVIGTASPGGTYYVYGETLAKILTRSLDLPVVRAPTEGPMQNIELMETGEAMLGFVTVGVALQAWNGTGVWAGRKPARAMRAIFPMYDTPLQFLVLQDTGIRTFAEMAGKRVGIGPRGGTSAAYFPELFKALGVRSEERR